MTDINLREIQWLNVSAAKAVIEAFEKVVSRLGKYKQDLSMELLTPSSRHFTFHRTGNKGYKSVKKGYPKIKVTS